MSLEIDISNNLNDDYESGIKQIALKYLKPTLRVCYQFYTFFFIMNTFGSIYLKFYLINNAKYQYTIILE